jgi:hypothetical protein
MKNVDENVERNEEFKKFSKNRSIFLFSELFFPKDGT